MPSHKKLLKLQQRASLATRGEWSLLLVTTLCALLAISPAFGAPLAASTLTASSLSASSAPVSEAMLWWLGNQLNDRQSTASAACRAMLPQACDVQEVAGLLAAFEHTASIQLHHATGDCNLGQSGAATATVEWIDSSDQHSPDYPPAATARYDASRRLMQYSLDMPVAAARSGLRTNRYHE